MAASVARRPGRARELDGTRDAFLRPERAQARGQGDEKMIRKLTSLLCALGLAAAGAAGCDVDQTREGRAPEVDVREGELPRYDIEGPEVQTGTRTETVERPEVDVGTREERIERPTVDIDTPD
jgi:hypothetical protein